MEIHNGYQHQWRCDSCRKIRINCLCLTFRAIHICIKCWFKLKKKFELENFLFQYRKRISPLSKQKWFRDMVDRISRGEKLGQYAEPPLCNHQNGCNHKEGFHSKEIPTANGHISKSEVYLFVKIKGKVVCVGR